MKSLTLVLAAASSTAFAASPLEEVVVFGERLTRPLGDTTQLATDLEINARAAPEVEHISQLLSAVPGAWVSRGSGQEHLTAIRSPVFTGPGACGAFWMAEDGVPLRAEGFCNVNQLFDSHYEFASGAAVFKGPNAALLGGSALFGAIATTLPGAAAVDTELSLKASEFGYKAVHGSHGIEAGRGRLAAMVSAIEDDGYRADSGFSQQKITVKHGYAQGERSFEQSLSLNHLEQETAGYLNVRDGYRDLDLVRANENPEAYRDADALRYFARWRGAKGATRWSFTPIVRANRMEFLMHFVPWQPTEENWHHSAGYQLRIDHTLGNGQLTFGHELETTYGGLSEIQYQPSPFSPATFPEGVHYDYRVAALSMGGYAAGFWQLSERLALEAALRLDGDRYDYETRAAAGSACAPDVTNCRFYRPEDDSRDFFEPSAQVGFTFELRPELRAFGRVATGFRLPETSELYRAQAPDQVALDPERVTSVELGLRGAAPAWFWQLGAFAMVGRDQIFQDPQRRYVNGAETEHLGLEYELAWTPAEQFYAGLSGSYARHTYTNNPELLELGAEPLPLDGLEIDTAPRHQHRLELAYRPAGIAEFALGLWHLGEYYLDPLNLEQYPGHTLASLRVSRAFGPLRATLGVHNLTDKRYADRADVQTNGEPRYFPGQERSVSLGLSWRPAAEGGR